MILHSYVVYYGKVCALEQPVDRDQRQDSSNEEAAQANVLLRTNRDFTKSCFYVYAER